MWRVRGGKQDLAEAIPQQQCHGGEGGAVCMEAPLAAPPGEVPEVRLDLDQFEAQGVRGLLERPAHEFPLRNVAERHIESVYENHGLEPVELGKNRVEAVDPACEEA